MIKISSIMKKYQQQKAELEKKYLSMLKTEKLIDFDLVETNK